VELAWSGACSMRADLETDIEIARRAGYPLLEIWGAKLRHYLQRHKVAELADRFKESGVKPLSINSVEKATFSGKDWENVERTCREFASVAGEIGCESIVVTPGKRPPGVTDSEVKDETVAVLEAFGDIAATHDVKIAFEFLGFPWCSVHTLEKAWEIIAEVDRPDVGLVVDTFHFHIGGSQLGSLRRIDSSKLFLFHVSDCEDKPLAQIQDANRLLPGAGILPIKRITEELKAIGYDRLASLELFRPEYWEREPFEFAVAAKAAMEKALGLTK
jgi:2-keto-myo-inositol isomerase